MIYLYAYLALGSLTLAAVLLLHFAERQSSPNSWHKLLEDLNPDRHQIGYQILHKLVAPTLVGIFVVVAWPAVIYLIRQKQSRAVATTQEGNEPEFLVMKKHLGERFSQAEVEALEMIPDPLGAVPALPFGHLHAKWREFLGRAGEGDEIWSFSAVWLDEWGCKEIRTGYAHVNRGGPGKHFLKSIRKLSSR